LVCINIIAVFSTISYPEQCLCAAKMALALGKLNFSCAVIGLTFINRACRQRTGTPKFRGSGCQFPQGQCHPSPRTGIALGTRLYLAYTRGSAWIVLFARFDWLLSSGSYPCTQGAYKIVGGETTVTELIYYIVCMYCILLKSYCILLKSCFNK
jgi:hypothetical protein